MIRDRITDNGTLFPALRQGIPGPAGPAGGELIISATAPTSPTDGTQWIDTDGWIYSVWSDEETAWIVPATNSIPSGAFTSPSGSPYLSPSGEYYIAA